MFNWLSIISFSHANISNNGWADQLSPQSFFLLLPHSNMFPQPSKVLQKAWLSKWFFLSAKFVKCSSFPPWFVVRGSFFPFYFYAYVSGLFPTAAWPLSPLRIPSTFLLNIFYFLPPIARKPCLTSTIISSIALLFLHPDYPYSDLQSSGYQTTDTSLLFNC